MVYSVYEAAKLSVEYCRVQTLSQNSVTYKYIISDKLLRQPIIIHKYINKNAYSYYYTQVTCISLVFGFNII